jgi:hypothetical protein
VRYADDFGILRAAEEQAAALGEITAWMSANGRKHGSQGGDGESRSRPLSMSLGGAGLQFLPSLEAPSAVATLRAMDFAGSRLATADGASLIRPTIATAADKSASHRSRGW